MAPPFATAHTFCASRDSPRNSGHILHGKLRVTIWRVKVRIRVRVMWVTIWYLTMNYLPNSGFLRTVPTETEVFLRGLSLGGKSRS